MAVTAPIDSSSLINWFRAGDSVRGDRPPPTPTTFPVPLVIGWSKLRNDRETVVRKLIPPYIEMNKDFDESVVLIYRNITLEYAEMA